MKKRKLLTLLVSICLVLSLAVVPFTTACEEKPPETLRIGSLYGMTGWASGGCIPQGEGAQVCAEWINEQGGITIDGQQYLIELVEADTECTAEGAAAGATKLVYDEGLEYIVNTAMPPIVMGAATVTEPAGVLRSICWNCGMPDEFGPQTPYTFLGFPTTLLYFKGTARYLSETYPEVETIELLMQDDGSIAALFPKLQGMLADFGITVTEPIAVPWDAVDYVPVTTQAVNRNPDAIGIINGWPFVFGSMLKTAREMGYEGPVTVLSMAACADVLEVAGPEASTNFFSGSHSYSSLDDPKMPSMIKDVAARLEAKYGYYTHYHLEGFQALWSLLQAMEEAQSLDVDEIIAAWEQMDTIETVFGTGSMGGLETFGINHAVNCPVMIESMDDGVVTFEGVVEDVSLP